MIQEVSVIIPNYNNAYWLPSCIASCLAQQPFLKEIIVVDDHSTDESLKIIENLQKDNPGLIKYFINPGKGANEARNFGFSQSSGLFIQWLDSDDEILPKKFEQQILALEKSQADIAYSDFRFDHYENEQYVTSTEKKFEPRSDYLLELLKENWNVTHSYLVTKKIASALSNGVGWNPQTEIGQDREYFTMAGILGAKFTYVPGIYAIYNKQDSRTISTMDFNKRLELNQVLEKRFRLEIENSQLIPDWKKKDYYKILNTHQIKACFYNRNIKLDRIITPFNIDWSIVHWKMRIVLPIIMITRSLQFYFDSVIKSRFR